MGPSIAGGGERWRVDWRCWEMRSRWPKEVAGERGGFCMTRVGVKRGRWVKRRARIARRKVEREGEPKARWV